MRWAAILVVVAGCDGSSSGIGDDRPPAEGELACQARTALPPLPALCRDGWCIDAPAPIGHLAAVYATDGELWFSTPTDVVRVVDGRSEWYPQPSLGPVSRFVGSSTAGMWGLSGGRFFRLEGATWVPIANLTIMDISVAPDGAAWAIASTQLLRYENGAWHERPAGTQGYLGRIAAVSHDDVWLSEERGTRRFLVHRTESETTRTEIELPIAAMWASSSRDVWYADVASVTHREGSDTWRFPMRDVRSIVGRSRDDVWALTGDGSQIVSHWNGATWSACDKPGTDIISPGGAGELWMVNQGMLVHYGGAWSWSHPLEYLQDFDVVSPAEQLAVTTTTLLRRTSDGTWRTEPAPYGMRGIATRGAADVWTFGYTAMHAEGTSWIDTHGPDTVDLCVTPSHEAFATSEQSILRYDGMTWRDEIDSGGSSQLFCLDDGQVWAGGASVDTVMKRDGTTWATASPADQLFDAYGPAGGPLWSVVGYELDRFDGVAWRVADISQLVAQLPGPPVFYDVVGTSATDVWFLIDVAGMRYVAHHDGSTFDRIHAAPGTEKIFALGSGDLMLVGASFATQRLRNGSITNLSPGISSDALGNYDAAVWFGSARVGWASSNDHHLLRWDGRRWTRDTHDGSRLLAFSAIDVWTLSDAQILSHWDGQQWQTIALPALQYGEDITDLWGASSAELWLVTQMGRIFKIVNGVATEISTPSTLAGLSSVYGTGANDVWFGGTAYSPAHSYALFHWDGQTFTQYQSLHRIAAMKLVDGELYARAEDQLWQYTDGRWIRRTDLAVSSVFPAPSSMPPGATRLFGDPTQWWAIGDDVIWRHE